MDKELHNRIKEATDKFCEKNGLMAGACASQISYGYGCMRDGFIAGAELGYKEAIKMAKEWLEKKAHFAKAQYCNCEDSEDDYYNGKVDGLEGAIADFENDMNKLLEE